jgi:hypothetical protein
MSAYSAISITPDSALMVLFCESDAAPPKSCEPVEVLKSDERFTCSEWFRWVKRQMSVIGLLLSADFYLYEGFEQQDHAFDRPNVFLALPPYKPVKAGFHLNEYLHLTRNVWWVRAKAELPEGQLSASSFPLGFPGCVNLIEYVMRSHFFRVCNSCNQVSRLHMQASTTRAYDKTGDHLYDGVIYVYPSLSQDEDAELEFSLWSSSTQRTAGALVKQQAIEQGLRQLRHGQAEEAQVLLGLQQFIGLSWLMHEAVGSVNLQDELHPFFSEGMAFLPLMQQVVELQLLQTTKPNISVARMVRNSEFLFLDEVA